MRAAPLVAALALAATSLAGQQPRSERARDLGIPLDGTPGPLDAITDVPGVTVGHSTIVRGSGRLAQGKGRSAPASPPCFRGAGTISRRCSPAGSASTATAR